MTIELAKQIIKSHVISNKYTWERCGEAIDYLELTIGEYATNAFVQGIDLGV